jgi:diguanylate cyclase (GGDEF)-like protein
MDAGADDYVTKPFEMHELRARLRAGIRVVTLEHELVLAREALREQATRDGLTGIWNRTSILEILQRELARAEREKTPLSLALVDLDFFKKINDQHGHLAGDAVLRQAARRMLSRIRVYDSAGRYGGEEFLIVLPGCGLAGAITRTEELRAAIAESDFELESGPAKVSCSIGLSWLSDANPALAEALVRRADEALYLAKRKGRNRVESLEAFAAGRLLQGSGVRGEDLGV